MQGTTNATKTKGTGRGRSLRASFEEGQNADEEARRALLKLRRAAALLEEANVTHAPDEATVDEAVRLILEARATLNAVRGFLRAPVYGLTSEVVEQVRADGAEAVHAAVAAADAAIRDERARQAEHP